MPKDAVVLDGATAVGRTCCAHVALCRQFSKDRARRLPQEEKAAASPMNPAKTRALQEPPGPSRSNGATRGKRARRRTSFVLRTKLAGRQARSRRPRQGIAACPTRPIALSYSYSRRALIACARAQDL